MNCNYRLKEHLCNQELSDLVNQESIPNHFKKVLSEERKLSVFALQSCCPKNQRIVYNLKSTLRQIYPRCLSQVLRCSNSCCSCRLCAKMLSGSNMNLHRNCLSKNYLWTKYLGTRIHMRKYCKQFRYCLYSKARTYLIKPNYSYLGRSWATSHSLPKLKHLSFMVACYLPSNCFHR